MSTVLTRAGTAAASTAGPDASEIALLKLAREGDGDAFAKLTVAYRAELCAHCYRMLGSIHDAEDALQDALLRAWLGLPGFEGRSSMRTWLHAIASNAALDIARRRSRRELPMNLSPAAENGTSACKPRTPLPEPHPSHWLTATTATPPDARYEQRESVELALTAALRGLPSLQRTALLLCAVAGFPAADIALQLGTSTASINSALQRARANARARGPALSRQQVPRTPGSRRIRAIAGRYADAMERGDTATQISLLRAWHQADLERLAGQWPGRAGSGRTPTSVVARQAGDRDCGPGRQSTPSVPCAAVTPLLSPPRPRRM